MVTVRQNPRSSRVYREAMGIRAMQLLCHRERRTDAGLAYQHLLNVIGQDVRHNARNDVVVAASAVGKRCVSPVEDRHRT
jgi:hypothetical protein